MELTISFLFLPISHKYCSDFRCVPSVHSPCVPRVLSRAFRGLFSCVFPSGSCSRCNMFVCYVVFVVFGLFGFCLFLCGCI